MILNVPKWSIAIKDEGAFTFAAFADRMCRVHGFDEMYTIHIDDVVRMCNKRSHGIIEWLRSIPEIADNIELGHLYEHVICFKLFPLFSTWSSNKFHQANNNRITIIIELNLLVLLITQFLMIRLQYVWPSPDLLNICSDVTLMPHDGRCH